MNTQQNSAFKQIGVKKFIPGIIWFLVILVIVCTPGDKIPEVDNWLIQINYDKLIHLGVFAVMAFLFMRPVAKSSLSKKEKWHYCIKIALATAIWGITTELIQKFFIPSRSFSISDFIADALGGLAALIFCKRRFFKFTTINKAGL